jgi:4'-phosphopantetheinyl transferase
MTQSWRNLQPQSKLWRNFLVEKELIYSRWEKENCPYDPGTDLIDLWRVDISNPELDRHQQCLSADERQRADKFLRNNVRNTFVRSRCALRLILARCIYRQAPAPTHAGAIEFRYGDRGKPELASPALEDFQFNLSHSENIALIVVSKNRRVGIDINNLSPSIDWRAIARRSFSSSELNLLFKVSELDQEKTFHRIWTQKEAYTKAIGDGYAHGFKKFSVVVDADDGSSLLDDDSHFHSAHEWNITSINAGSNCVAALAYAGPPVTKIRQWEFCID